MFPTCKAWPYIRHTLFEIWLIIQLCCCGHVAWSQQHAADMALANGQARDGFMRAGTARLGYAIFTQWAGDGQTRTTITVYVPGKRAYHFPDEAAFAEFLQLGLEQADHRIGRETARRRFSEAEAAELRVAAGLQMSNLLRAAKAHISRLNQLDISDPTSQSDLYQAQDALNEFLNPRFYAPGALYYKILCNMEGSVH